MPTCRNCGNELNTTSKFCSKCGATVLKDEIVEPTESTADSVHPVEEVISVSEDHFDKGALIFKDVVHTEVLESDPDAQKKYDKTTETLIMLGKAAIFIIAMIVVVLIALSIFDTGKTFSDSLSGEIRRSDSIIDRFKAWVDYSIGRIGIFELIMIAAAISIEAQLLHIRKDADERKKERLMNEYNSMIQNQIYIYENAIYAAASIKTDVYRFEVQYDQIYSCTTKRNWAHPETEHIRDLCLLIKEPDSFEVTEYRLTINDPQQAADIINSRMKTA